LSSVLVLDADSPGALDAAEDALRAGGIVGLPTETVYGLAVLPDPTPVAALIAAKQRPHDKGIALLIDGVDQIELLVTIPDAARTLMSRFWPGALTLVLRLLPGVALPDAITGARPTLGVRLPDHPIPRALARRLGPLAVSSANLSGATEARSAPELVDAVGEALALVLDGGPVRGGVASTVVGVDPDGSWRVLRAGALSEGALHAAVD
jgi:L-threonylcarbamoyladenylate synthase